MQPVTGVHIVTETQWVDIISIIIEFLLKDFKGNFHCDFLIPVKCKSIKNLPAKLENIVKLGFIFLLAGGLSSNVLLLDYFLKLCCLLLLF